MPGPERTQQASAATVKVPRPPNAWIIFRSEMVKVIDKVDTSGTRKTQAVISKEISAMWQNAPQSVKDDYERRAEAKKQEHQMVYPDYRFAPMKKEEKERLREQKRLEREKESKSNRKRARVAPYASPYLPVPHSSSSPNTPPVYPLTMPYGPYGPSPPLSAASSPSDSPAEGSQLPQLQYDASSFIASPQPSASHPMPIVNVPEQPVAGPSNWQQDQDALSLPALPSNDSYGSDGQGYLHFDLMNPAWMSNDSTAEFDQSIQALLTATGDPSIFQMSNVDPSELNGQPLDVSLGGLIDPKLFPDMSNWDLSSLALESNGQPFLNQTQSEYPTAVGDSSEGQSRLASDEYFDYEAAGVDISASATVPPTPVPTTVDLVPARAATTTPYAPPQGASQASTRRVGGTWRPFATPEEAQSPRSYSVPA